MTPDGSKLDKVVKSAIKYVTTAKRSTIATSIIDNLLKQLKTYLETLSLYQSELELSIFELAIKEDREEISRLKRIISLYDGNDNLTNEQINILEYIKEPSQFYQGNSADFILFKYKFIDIVLKNKLPEKLNRPVTIEQIEKTYEILTKRYGHSKN